MALILAFDTSGPYCAAAVLRDGQVAFARNEPMNKGQAERLMPLLEELLAEAEITLRDLEALAVGVGPGNFTGIRLSVAAARGLALSLGIPAIGVSSLEAQAYGGPRPMLSCLDARRGAVYIQRFEETGAEPPSMMEDPDDLPLDIPRIGDGPGAVPAAFPMVEAIARIAAERVGATNQRPAPLYIRPADAAPSRDAPPQVLR